MTLRDGTRGSPRPYNLHSGSSIALSIEVVSATRRLLIATNGSWMMKPYFVATALLVVAAAASAHDTWLLPEQFAVAPDSALALDLTSGTAFPEPDTPIDPARVARAAFRLHGQSLALTDLSAAAHSLRVQATPAAQGIATVWMELAPQTIELTAPQVEAYLAEIDAPDLVKRRWIVSRPQRWRERYTKHAKTFVRVGDAAADHSWSEPVGMYLELVPQSDPTRLVAGDTLVVQVLRDGISLPGFALAVQRESGAAEQMQRTDGGGNVSFDLDRPGRWLVRGTWLLAVADPAVDWESHFTTLTLDVGAR
jgi:uncharacterized GH25 family protein